MLRELDYIEDDGTALRWALGCFRAGCLARFSVAMRLCRRAAACLTIGFPETAGAIIMRRHIIWIILAAPLKIERGSGSPLRVLALVRA